MFHFVNPSSTKQQEIDQYTKMVAFVMSYSFSDTEQLDPLRQTQMVPVIDLLNHHSYHHAELMFQRDYLLLTAIRDIKRVSHTIADCSVHSHKGRGDNEYLWEIG